MMLRQQRGAVVNVASVAAFMPASGNVTYAATKACLTVFTQGLAGELVGSGVVCQALCPGYTFTSLHDTPDFAGFDRYRASPPIFWMPADAVVRASLSTGTTRQAQLPMRRSTVACD